MVRVRVLNEWRFQSTLCAYLKQDLCEGRDSRKMFQSRFREVNNTRLTT